MSPAVKVVTWVLFAVWAAAGVTFFVKYHEFVKYPLGHPNTAGGGIFFIISQAALGAAVILIWQTRKQDA
jgi:hypothetical protein